MDVTINARHCTVPASLRNQVARRVSRLERFSRRVTAATVVFDGAPNRHEVETRLVMSGGPPIIAHAESATMRSALDDAFERVERQLKRRRKRSIDRRTRGARNQDESGVSA